MMKTENLNLFTNLFFFVGMALLSLPANAQSVNPQSMGAGDRTSAYFDYLYYKGNDSYYNLNPLPGKEFFYNPVLPGWFSDPGICSNGEDYFLVTSTFAYFPGVPIFHSRDLVNWQQIGFVLDRPSQLKLDGQRTSEGIFAPTINYNPHNQTYYMITTHVGAGNFFVKTKDPFGTWSDPVWLRDVRGIDPSFFFDEDGKVFILNNDEPEGPAQYPGHRAVRIREFDLVNERTIGPEKVLIDGGIHPEEKPIWIEGPHMYNINGKYYLMAAEGGTGPDHSEVILRGDSPMGNFVAWDKNPILTQRHLDPKRVDPVTCAGHADLIQAKEGDWWAVFLATRPVNGLFENLGRETFLMPVRWSPDSFPYLTQGDELVPMVLSRKGVERKSDVTFGNFEIQENFDVTVLPDNFLTLRSPASDLYSLTVKPGFITLACADISTSEKKTPSYIARRLQHHLFECSTSVLFDPLTEDDAAGLLLYKDEYHQYFLSIRKAGTYKKISLEKITEEGSQVLAESIIKGSGPIGLKVVSKATLYDFYYSSGEDTWNLLCPDVDAYFLSTANIFGFTGTTIGMYATSAKH